MIKLKLFLLLFVFSFFANAQKVTINNAETVAKNFYYEHTGVKQNSIIIENVIPYTNGKDVTFYIFDIVENNGFVIVSAEYAYEPIIGYSDNSIFKLQGIPENIKSLFNEYSKKITFVRNNKIKATKNTVDLWKKYNVSYNSFVPNKNINDVLLETGNWNQDGGYDDWLPTSDEGTPAVGCVATAMGEILNYWKYPSQGTGSTSYWSSFSSQVLSVNFAESIYPWNLMDNDNVGNDFEALISYHCGVAVHMSYDVSANGGSGSYVAYGSNSALNAFQNYFKYNSSTISFQDKSDYSDTNWKQLLKTEINNGRPILYRGTSSEGGHAFVCDGYNNSDYFHYNFGWGGYDNGYFSINDVNGFNSNNGAIVGIQPSEEVSYLNPPQNFVASVNTENTSEYTVDLSWDAPETKTVSSYKIFRIDYEHNGYDNEIVEVANVSSSTFSYLDNNSLEAGEKDYIIQAIYTDGESEFVNAKIDYGYEITFNFKDAGGNNVNQVNVTLTNNNDYDESNFSSFLSFSKFQEVSWGGGYTVTVSKSGYETTVDNIDFVNQDATYNIIMGQGLVNVKNVKNDEFTIYPNPANDFLYLKTNSVLPFSYKIYDINGRTLQNGYVDSDFKKLSIENLRNGLYFISLSNNLKTINSTFVKE